MHEALRRPRVLLAESKVWEAQARVHRSRLSAEDAAAQIVSERLARGWELEEAALRHALVMQELLLRGAERLRALAGPEPSGNAPKALPAPQGPPMLPDVTEDDLEAAAVQYAFRLHGLAPAEQERTLARLPADLRSRFDPYTAAELERRIRRLLELSR